MSPTLVPIKTSLFEREFAKLTDKSLSKLVIAANCLLHNHADAEDAVQCVLLHIWQKRSQFRGESRLLTYLSVAVRNHCFYLLRSRKAHMGREQPLESWYPDRQTQQQVDARLKLHAVKKLLSIDHRRRSRRLVIQKRLDRIVNMLGEGFTYLEIGRCLHMGEGAVKSAVFRMRLLLRGVAA